MTIKKRKFEFTGNRITSLFYVPIFFGISFNWNVYCPSRGSDQSNPNGAITWRI